MGGEGEGGRGEGREGGGKGGREAGPLPTSDVTFVLVGMYV